MEKRLNDWLGPLSATQQLRVVAWSNALGDQNTQWIANRAHWQKQFSAAVAQRQSPEFPQRIETLLVNRESLWTPAYRQAYASTEAQARALFVDLMAESTPEQRQRLLKKIEGVRKDFNDLKCLKAAQAELSATQVQCGSEPAREGGVTVNITVDCHTAFASKLAPTLVIGDLQAICAFDATSSNVTSSSASSCSSNTCRGWSLPGMLLSIRLNKLEPRGVKM